MKKLVEWTELADSLRYGS